MLKNLGVKIGKDAEVHNANQEDAESENSDQFRGCDDPVQMYLKQMSRVPLLKLISGMQLCSRTGASIMGIERDGAGIINPNPDEELHPGDQILILGAPA